MKASRPLFSANMISVAIVSKASTASTEVEMPMFPRAVLRAAGRGRFPSTLSMRSLIGHGCSTLTMEIATVASTIATSIGHCGMA
jgi:hypothetical protein